MYYGQLGQGPFSTCLWWPLHLDNWYLSLCIGHGGDSHAVPVLLVKVKYSVYIYIYIFYFLFFPYLLIISLLIAHLWSLIYWQLLLKVYFTGNKTIYIQTNCTGGIYNYMTLSIFPCCYYVHCMFLYSIVYCVHCMFVFYIVNHSNCYAPCGSLIGQ